VWVIAAGKAAVAMARTALAVLGDRVRGGLVISPNVDVPAIDPLLHLSGEHPQPGAGSEAAGRRALGFAARIPADAACLMLISGGASSLMTVPVDGISLSDKRATTGVLLRSGADIHALNTVRKHLSAIKGGRLAAACQASSRTLVLSDVVDDDPSVIASGPTVADRSTYADALAVVDRFGGRGAYPAAVVAHLVRGARGEAPESPKPGDPRLARAQTQVIGGRRDAMGGAAAEAERRGYRVLLIEEAVVGEARAAGADLATRVLDLATGDARGGDEGVCVIASGETTVHVRGQGLGGRNQELALACAAVLARSHRSIVLASVGTDGIDGPTEAAGAIVDTTTIARAAAAGLPAPATFLDDNNTHAFFEALDDLIRTGPTGTNVGDLQVALLT
jgi:hydroxypyruvate reductase